MAAKTVAALYRASRSPQDSWDNDSVVSDTVCSRHAIESLKDLCGSDTTMFIDGNTLKHVKSLGEGAFAVVSVALYSGPDGKTVPPRSVAVKQLKPHVMQSESDVLDFIEEVRVLNKLQQKNIVEFIGFGALDTSSREAEWRTIFLVQEYMGGGTLQSRILNQMIDRTKPVYTFAQGLQWCHDIAEGLAAMHSSSPMVIHRDLKAENVLVTATTPGSVAKIADLGLHALVEQTTSSDGEAVVGVPLQLGTGTAPPSNGSELKPTKDYVEVNEGNFRNGEAEADPSRQTFWKMTGKTGAYCYMAPEVLAGKPYNEKVDTFSFGVVLFEVMSKRLVGADYMNTQEWDESEQHATKVSHGWRPSFPAFMPEEVKQLITACWSGLPELRPSMPEIVQRLEKIKNSGVVEELDEKAASSQDCCSIM